MNTLNWNEDGSKLVTGSDDRTIVVWAGEQLDKVIGVPTGHRNNVFCATFLPNSNDSQFVTSAADGSVHLLNIDSGSREVLYECDSGAYCFKHCMDLQTPQASGLVTLSDGFVVRFDVRSKSGARIFGVQNDPYLQHLSMGRFSTPPSGTDIAFNPANANVFSLGTSTKAVLLYDQRALGRPLARIIPAFTKRSPLYAFTGDTEAVSGFAWDRHGRVIVNYCRQSLVEIDTVELSFDSRIETHEIGSDAIPREWTGRTNHQTFLKEVCLFGCKQEYVVTGGDCGNLFIWSRFGTGDLVLRKPADPHILNCVKPHPSLPILATSGIASEADVWGLDLGCPRWPIPLTRSDASATWEVNGRQFEEESDQQYAEDRHHDSLGDRMYPPYSSSSGDLSEGRHWEVEDDEDNIDRGESIESDEHYVPSEYESSPGWVCHPGSVPPPNSQEEESSFGVDDEAQDDVDQDEWEGDDEAEGIIYQDSVDSDPYPDSSSGRVVVIQPVLTERFPFDYDDPEYDEDEYTYCQASIGSEPSSRYRAAVRETVSPRIDDQCRDDQASYGPYWDDDDDDDDIFGNSSAGDGPGPWDEEDDALGYGDERD